MVSILLMSGNAASRSYFHTRQVGVKEEGEIIIMGHDVAGASACLVTHHISHLNTT